MNEKLAVLKEYFGHSEFRQGQEKIVDCLLSGKDALCIMPTGAGKSICYQIPALVFDGVTLVISPLISLMKDQVTSLVQSGISAAYINSSLNQSQYFRVLENAASGKYKIIYVAPERLVVPEFTELCDKIKISMVAVDEAHCVSQWGQDFRPSYLKIVEFIESLPCRPVIGAFTATATKEVKEDILKILKLNKPLVVTTGFNRSNLFFSVMKPKNKDTTLIDLIKERSEKSGIVYCSTRKAVEEVCELINQNGFSATRYHAGLSENERKENQEDFVFDRKQIMVATNAFGMGIDKSNVSYVIHYNMPKNIESYYQEAGRAGRDGSQADCILLYSPQDVFTNRFLIEKSEDNPELTEEEQYMVREKDFERLKQMTLYCTTNDCLRKFILKYFGDKADNYCGKCSNCLTQFETIDITVDTQKILSCIIKTGQRYGKKMICDVLRGSKNERLLRFKLDNQSTYGIMKDSSEKRIRNIIEHLEQIGFIFSEGGEYPVLKVSATSYGVLKGKSPLSMKIPKEQKKEPKPAVKAADINAVIDKDLLDELKQLRRKLAIEKNVPAYIIFSDATLTDMCKKLPMTSEEFLTVSGVGKTKLAQYGEIFLETINNYLIEQS
ncbi:MAG TPA: DNA helicase RecQ [Candidatus Limousia pullorum]|uniref:DNA helicase RecQ n=1 Tax=Candidatus Limousia pullorum TaxID=2840860 RepID=A0A9D1LZ14_9FIRM|nr:DNA helicase RecQ [Candidatus Limousia pullorum]